MLDHGNLMRVSWSSLLVLTPTAFNLFFPGFDIFILAAAFKEHCCQ